VVSALTPDRYENTPPVWGLTGPPQPVTGPSLGSIAREPGQLVSSLDPRHPANLVNWATLLFPGTGKGMRIPDQTVPTSMRGITISRVPYPPHPWRFFNETLPSQRMSFRKGQKSPLYVHYQATNRRGQVVGGITMAYKRHANGQVTAQLPVAWTQENLMHTPLLNDMLAIPRATRTAGIKVHVPKHQALAHRLMHE
jgi:hypothetical protein